MSLKCFSWFIFTRNTQSWIYESQGCMRKETTETLYDQLLTLNYSQIYLKSTVSNKWIAQLLNLKSNHCRRVCYTSSYYRSTDYCADKMCFKLNNYLYIYWIGIFFHICFCAQPEKNIILMIFWKINSRLSKSLIGKRKEFEINY